jgi:RNA polymerase sigma factor (sigma-70 family)
MNPIPVAKTTVDDSHAQFLAIYPLARRAAEVRTAAAVARGIVTRPDGDDLVQEVLVAVWRALPRYNPSRGSLRTFVECVVATRFASLMRARRRQPTLKPLDSYLSVGLGGILAIEFRTDFQRVSSFLARCDRRLARILVDHSPTEASRALGVSRSTVYERIRQIRVVFEMAGLRPRAGRGQ